MQNHEHSYTFVYKDSNLFIVQDIAILDVLSIQPQKNFHNRCF